MLFFAAALATTAAISGWPCQRLNWAWRNVWVTCSINNVVPAAAGSGTFTGFTFSAPLATGYQLDSTGAFNPTGVYSPQLCQTSPNTGGSFMRNRCRRMLDTYGNLVGLCKTPAKVGPNLGPNTLTPDYLPQGAQQPHAQNVAQLTFMAQECLTPGVSFPTPSTTCPGLVGWYTVVWNACGFTNAPGVVATPAGSLVVPNYISGASPAVTFATPVAGEASIALATPAYWCGSTGTPGVATAPNVWNVKGALAGQFKTSRCRKALDQFGRTAARCAPNVAGTSSGNNDWLRFLAADFGSHAPYCNA